MSFQPFSLLFGGWETGFRVPFVPHFTFSPAGRGQNVVKIVAGGQTGKDYYKEASAIHDYLVDFSDHYISFTSKMEQYRASYDSWEIEFDFIFGKDSYKTYGDAHSRFIEEREAQAQ